MTDTTINAATAVTNGTASSTAVAQLDEDYQTFLTLLTAQIENQDPLSPMDSTEFVTQLAMLSEVEQTIETNTNLEAIQSQLGAMLSVSGPDMLGKTVTVPSDLVVLADGETQSLYTVTEGADTASAQIFDPLGNLIRDINGLPIESGELLPLNWDGRDNLGNPVLEGNYTVTISAYDENGDPVDAFTYREAEVKEVLYSGGYTYFALEGDETAAAEALLSVK